MKIVTADEIRRLDRIAIQEYGIPGSVLMENAGRAVVDVVAQRFGALNNLKAWVACGTGNNGGDGFVIARLLAAAGAEVRVQLVGDEERIQGDARIHYDLLKKLNATIGSEPFLQADVRIDALLGTGVSGAPREEIATAIEALNQPGAPVFAVDIPSGVNADTGETPGAAVKARVTVTFGYPKLGLFLPPGADAAGELVVNGIGFPWDAVETNTPYRWMRPEGLQSLLPERARESHKGTFGHLLVVGGSRGMGGAPAMSARSAMRTGVGLVTIAVPESIQSVVAGRLDEAMTRALPEVVGALAVNSVDMVLHLAERCDVVCLGPGLSQEPEAQAVAIKLLSRLEKPVVLDADGLNALAARPDSLHGRKYPTILTPHPGECARLLNSDTASIQSNRVASVREAAKRYNAVVVLKGARTLICDGRNGTLPVAVNTTGNPGMATGGSGDTLTGIIGALAARGMDNFDAACLGVYLHGSAGDIAAESIGPQGLVAGDIAEAVPEAISELLAHSSTQNRF